MSISWIKIPLTQGKSAVIDLADFELVSQYKWSYHENNAPKPGYAVRRSKEGKIIKMHQQIMGSKSGFVPDHKNGIGTDNRRSNLRYATKAQNGINRGVNKNNTSGYKGVTKSRDKWVAQLPISGRSGYIGSFSDKHSAARAYNEAALKEFGEFARLNEIKEII